MAQLEIRYSRPDDERWYATGWLDGDKPVGTEWADSFDEARSKLILRARVALLTIVHRAEGPPKCQFRRGRATDETVEI